MQHYWPVPDYDNCDSLVAIFASFILANFRQNTKHQKLSVFSESVWTRPTVTGHIQIQSPAGFEPPTSERITLRLGPPAERKQYACLVWSYWLYSYLLYSQQKLFSNSVDNVGSESARSWLLRSTHLKQKCCYFHHTIFSYILVHSLSTLKVGKSRTVRCVAVAIT